MKYDILSHTTRTSLIIAVNECLANGWELYGFPFFDESFFYQAMVKKTKSKSAKKSEKVLYGEYVRLTEEEAGKLREKHGEELMTRAIRVLDNYIGSKGDKYKSHYHTLLGWPIERVKDDDLRAKSTNPFKFLKE